MRLRDLFSGWRLGSAGSATVSELFTTRPPAWAFFLDFLIYPLLILACMWLALNGATPRAASEALALMGLGYGIWTFAEYVLHRYVLHHVPLFRQGHLAHHHAPRELIGTPTLASVAIFLVLVFTPLAMILGLRMGSALSVGLLAGYLSYMAVHYALHHWSSAGYGRVQRLKRHHALHHHRADDCNFGVTTMFWDRVFGTLK